jgi:tellurite resistance protein TehA-like permease
MVLKTFKPLAADLNGIGCAWMLFLSWWYNKMIWELLRLEVKGMQPVWSIYICPCTCVGITAAKQ